MSNLKGLIDAGHRTVKVVDPGGTTFWTKDKIYDVVGQKVYDDEGGSWGYKSVHSWPVRPTFEVVGVEPEATGVTLDSIADPIVELVLKKLQAKLEGGK